MSIRGVDTTDRALTGKILKANGYGFACRYVRNAPVSGGLDKQWTAAEVAEKSAAGVRVVANFEFGTRPANTKATGRDHAQIFLEELTSVGGPSWSPCYFSADYPAHAHDLDLYFEGIAETIGPHRSGSYTCGALFRQLKADGLITLAWQSMSKSFPGNHDAAGNWDHRGADLIQTGSGKVAGHSCDFDTAVIANYGGWLLGQPDPSKPQPPEVIDMLLTDKLPNGKTVADALVAASGLPASVWHTDQFAPDEAGAYTESGSARLDRLDKMQTYLMSPKFLADVTAAAGGGGAADPDAVAEATVSAIRAIWMA